MNNHKKYETNMSRVLLLGAGFIFLLAVLLYNEFLLVLFTSNPPISSITVAKIRWVQALFFILGFSLISISYIIKKILWIESVMKKELVTHILLVILPVFTLLFFLEFSLKPFAMIPTTIFVKDAQLGWKLKPNADDLWGDARVKINSKGLRGPVLDYAKRPNVKRILYLGDSVTFGYGLKSYEQSFPYLIEGMIENEVEYEIETINAGVDGYSQWQEYIFFSTEGIKYAPDLVVVSFILNDVTEKFGLTIFGGETEGFQLSQTISKKADNLFRRSSIVYFAKKVNARIRFGSNIQEGAKQQEALKVMNLVRHPNRQDVQKAWDITLQDLGKIFDYAKAKDIPVMLVVFPYTFQFEDVKASSTPQKIVSKYAFDNKVPVIDLLPIMSKIMDEEGRKPRDYFIDKDHLSPLGNEIVAEILADFIKQNKLLTNEHVN